MNDMTSIKGLLKDRPLLVCDIDEVVLEFLTPFQNFLQNNGFELHPKSFSLNGNISQQTTGRFIDNSEAKNLIEQFYSEQSNWQGLVRDARSVLNDLRSELDIVLLTAMPPNHYRKRLKLLENLEIDLPLLASEQAKGPMVKHLHEERPYPSFFIDDMVYNHKSVTTHAPKTNNIYFMANKTFRQIAPERPNNVLDAENWLEIKTIILNKI